MPDLSWISEAIVFLVTITALYVAMHANPIFGNRKLINEKIKLYEIYAKSIDENAISKGNAYLMESILKTITKKNLHPYIIFKVLGSRKKDRLLNDISNCKLLFTYEVLRGDEKNGRIRINEKTIRSYCNDITTYLFAYFIISVHISLTAGSLLRLLNQDISVDSWLMVALGSMETYILTTLIALCIYTLLCLFKAERSVILAGEIHGLMHESEFDFFDRKIKNLFARCKYGNIIHIHFLLKKSNIILATTVIYSYWAMIQHTT